MKVFTIGSNSKGLRRFAELIVHARVDCIIDVRLNNNSQLAGYSKSDDLAFALELMGIAYEHHPELAPTEELLSSYRKDKDWEAYIDGFDKLFIERDMHQVGRYILSRYQRPCLLCSEDSPENCHRRLLAECWAGNIPDLEVEHLQ